MNGKGVTRHYDRLGPEERFRLALEAGARGDDRERERLAQSAPMYPFRVADPDYMDRVDASRELAVAVALDLGPGVVALRLLTVAADLFASAFALGATATDPDKNKQAAFAESVSDLPAIQAVREAAQRTAREAAALWQAFGAVCREEIGLDPEVVLRAHLGPIVDMLDLDQLDDAEPDEAQGDAQVELILISEFDSLGLPSRGKTRDLGWEVLRIAHVSPGTPHQYPS